MAAPAGIIQEHNLRGMAVASISSGKLLLLEKRHMTSSVALVNSSLILTPYKSGSYSLDPGIISFRAQSLTLIKLRIAPAGHIDTLTPEQLSGSIKCIFVEGFELDIGICVRQGLNVYIHSALHR